MVQIHRHVSAYGLHQLLVGGRESVGWVGGGGGGGP